VFNLTGVSNPSVIVSGALYNGIIASASVPPEASTSIRDGDAKRYGAKGVLKAVANVNKSIAPKLEGKSPHAQKEVADLMRKLDGTETKAKLGTNAILSVSMTLCCRSMPASGNCMGARPGKASGPSVLGQARSRSRRGRPAGRSTLRSTIDCWPSKGSWGNRRGMAGGARSGRDA
jgi:hypothetical protein